MTNLKQKKQTQALRVDLLSLFPKYFQSPLEQSILKRALQHQLIEVHSHDIRDYATNAYGQVDDTSYGGGPGMVLMPEPVKKAIDHVKSEEAHVIYLSPQGKKLTPQKCKELAQKKHLILLSGHYEGIDQRIIDSEVDEEISIGDYIITSGCPAALVLLDAVARFIPGVIGDPESTQQDSFENTLFDHPHYTKPPKFNTMEVPEVLLSGHHAKIQEFRQKQAIQKTKEVRPDLYQIWQSHTADADILLNVKDLNEVYDFFHTLFPLKKEPDFLVLETQKFTLAFIEGTPVSTMVTLRVKVSGQEKTQILQGLSFQNIDYQEDAHSFSFIDPFGHLWLFTTTE